MMIIILITLILSITLLIVWLRWRQAVRADYIRTYMFPKGIFDKLQARRPELSLKDCQLTARALRQFFLAYLKGGRKFVAMPSQVADDLWHELILYTRHYEAFCNKAFGGFMHHTPAVVLGADRQNNAGLRRTWWYACLEENINPRKHTRLPLLFALDAKLNVADGFRYAPDCKALRDNRNERGSGSGTTHCGGDFSDSSYDGSTDGFADSPSGDGGGFGSGDSAGGCGGGCGGGGD
jgi:hypothetical protein